MRPIFLALLCLSACTPDGGGSDKPPEEICDNLEDDDLDDLADCADPDCAAVCGEVCTNGTDDDLDGLIDCLDDDCDGLCPENCGDGRDNDADGAIDCDDRDCFGSCPEVCGDGFDNDGDGKVDCLDEECVDPICAEICTDGRDNDADALVDCADDDCNDPGCVENCADGRDNDADGRVDCDDNDCDGDCPEICDDGRDNDADGRVDCDDTECEAECDADGDGFFNADYGGDDCDDTRADVNPSRPEICNGDEVLDDDCNGLFDEDDPDVDVFTLIAWGPDADGDGFGTDREIQFACQQPDGWGFANQDCDDTRADVNPDMPEICNADEPLDDDCDGRVDDDDPDVTEDSYLEWYADRDGDGFGADDDFVYACSRPDGTAATNDDCDDADPTVGRPSLWMPDLDGDGHGDGAPFDPVPSCDPPGPGYGPDWRGEDCDDGDPSIHPDAEEVCDDYIDQDCDGDDEPCNGDVLYAADGQCSGGTLYELNTETGAERIVCRLTAGYSGLAFDDLGTLYGIEDACSGGTINRIDLASCVETPIATPVRNETGLAWADGRLYAVDTSTSTHEVNPADGSTRSLGFSSANCCAADIAADEFGTMYYADSGSNAGIIDLATGAKTPLFPGEFRQALTFHNGELIGIAGGCTDVRAYDPISGSGRSLGVAFTSCTLDSVASPTP
ncbi:MAG: hypothetical protein ACI8PZ_000519 [Myxococcota bacterium]|jgi:hypothetical protein